MIEQQIIQALVRAFERLYHKTPDASRIQVQRTRPEFEGDFTVVVFPFLGLSGKGPEATASELGEYLQQTLPDIAGFNIIKGFLNLTLDVKYWRKFLDGLLQEPHYGFIENSGGDPVVVEFSSPNTNKPLHLGHIRNNLLGWSLAKILEAAGNRVIRVNLVNDRGIHICKTMLAYRKWHQGEDPRQTGKKGDKYVGELYVEFESANKSYIREGIAKGLSEDEAFRNSPLTLEAMDLLQRWENNDPEIRELWARMNGWVYEGFDGTYDRLGIAFDRVYHESDTYLLGKDLVSEGLDRGIFYRKEDGSVWIDLKDEGLDEKLLLRGDGTSVYITQDLGTAQLRYDDFHPQKLLYVVGNEQNYHFDVLKVVLKKLGREWAGDIIHVSYGMVELPGGRMKSREGTVVDADDLMEEMYLASEKMTMELGKSDGLSAGESANLFEMIGQAALKYFILKVDPKKNMLFNPEESIDFNGNTGPFIQYTHARIRSLLNKANEQEIHAGSAITGNFEEIHPKEKSILKVMHSFPQVVIDAGQSLNPALVANFAYELAKEYNQFYQEVPVLKEPDPEKVLFRLAISRQTGDILNRAMKLLGISMPERM